MRKRFPFLLLLAMTFPLLAAKWQTRIDLHLFLNDTAALHQLTVPYESAEKSGQVFLIHGDGRLLLQQLPREPGVWNSLVPTCTARVSEDTVRSLIKLLIANHFFDLPEKHFIFLTACADPEDAVHIHSIVLRFGDEEAGRSFATGSYQGRMESIPPEFAAVESAIVHLRETAFPPAKPCGLAPPASF